MNDSFNLTDRMQASFVNNFEAPGAVIGENDGGTEPSSLVPRPRLFIPLSDTDVGNRMSGQDPQLGPESPSVWFETFQANGEPGEVVTDLMPDGEYQIVVVVKNLGTGPSYSVCVDFFGYYANAPGMQLYKYIAYAPEALLFESQSIQIRSSKWIPQETSVFLPGDVIVRAFDPLFSTYQDTGRYFFIQNDPHLAHKRFA